MHATILLVDDHPIVRRGLAQLIDQEPDLSVCAEVADVQEALTAIDALHPQLVVADLTLRGGSGLDLIKILQTREPNLPVLVMSMHDERLYAERVLHAGARGYIMKQEATDMVLTAIRRVMANEIYVSERMAARILRQTFVKGGVSPEASPLARLSDRELDVFQLLGQGSSTRQIAEKLYLSVKTVETHRAHIMEKLSLENATELVRYATRWIDTIESK